MIKIRQIVLSFFILVTMSCLERSVPYSNSEHSASFTLNTGDVVRDIAMWQGINQDTLFLVNENEGLLSYEVLKDNSGYIDSLKFLHNQSFLTDTTEVKSIQLLENSRMWVALENFKYTYFGKIDEILEISIFVVTLYLLNVVAPRSR